MKTFTKIIINKYLWIAIVTVGCFIGGRLYLDQTSSVKQEVVAAKVKLKKDLYGVEFSGSDKGWIVGEGGLIVHTVDGGANWEIQKSDVTVNLVKINFLNAQKGFAVGAGGTLLMTANGGDTWEKKTTGTEAFLNDICFPDADIGFIVGAEIVLFTKDGGETWHQDNSVFKAAPQWLTPELRCIHFSSPLTGWIVGEFGTVLRTVDKGLSWNLVDVGTEDTLFGVCFLDPNNGHIVGSKGLILATEDGGQTWVRDATFKRQSDLYEVAYRELNNKRTPVYIAGKGEMAFALAMESARFESVMIDNVDVGYSWLYDIEFVSNTQAYAVGKSGLILHISQGEGDMWAKLDYNLQVK